MKPKQKRNRTGVYFFAVSLLCSVVSAFAQDPSPAAQQQNPSVRELHVIITDGKGHSVDDVQQKDVQVIENGAPQTIESFSLRELPIHYALMVDTSLSLRSQFPAVIETAKGIVAANRTGDKAFIVRFVHSSRINIVQEKTSDKTQLLNALMLLRVEAGQTALIDAIYATAEGLFQLARENRQAGKRTAIVLITDGENRASSHTEDDLFKLLQKGDLRVFVIGLVKELDTEGGITRKSPREKALNLIERLAKETGGRAFFPNSKESFSGVIADLVHNLQRQYVVEYRAQALAPGASYRVEVKVSDSPEKKKRRAILRPKYRAEELQQ